MSSLNNNASLESALVEVDYDSRIKEIYSRLASLDDRPLKDLTEIGRRNASRRAIHTDVELLAMDLEDKVESSEKPDSKSKPGRAFAELDQIKEKLVLKTMPPATGLEAIFMVSQRFASYSPSPSFGLTGSRSVLGAQLINPEKCLLRLVFSMCG